MSTNTGGTMTDNLSGKQIEELEVFSDQIKRKLDADQANIPASISEKLRNARSAALQEASLEQTSNQGFLNNVIDRKQNSLLSLFKPSQSPWLAACASAFAVVIFLSVSEFKSPTKDIFTELDTESELLFADENLDLYEDLEFYRWLANTGY